MQKPPHHRKPLQLLAVAVGLMLVGALLWRLLATGTPEVTEQRAASPDLQVAPRPSTEPGSVPPPDSDGAGVAAPAAASGASLPMQVECLAPVDRQPLPTEVDALAHDLLGGEADRQDPAVAMTQCLELRDAIARDGVELFERSENAARSRLREAVATCWALWSKRPEEEGLRAEVISEAVQEAAPLMEAQDWDGLLAMAPRLQSADAPTSPFDDWNPAVNLPWVIAVRAEAPVEHFLDLLAAGYAPTPRALSRLAMMERTDVLEALAASGVDLGTSDIAGQDVVQGAVQSGNPAMLEFLAGLGVDLNRRTLHGRAQYWPADGRPPDDAAALRGLIRQDPAMAAAAIRGGHAVRAADLEPVLRHLERDVADAVYRKLRAEGCI